MVIDWLDRLLWRYVACPRFNGGHKRDWDAYDLMGLVRCMHCWAPMDDPGCPRRERL